MKNKVRIWTDEETNFLKNNYPKYGSEYCSNILQRGKKAIVKRAQILKIKFEGVSFKYLKENLELIVKESKNIIEIIKKLGLKAAGGNHKTIMKYIKIYNIDINHFETPKERVLRTCPNFYSISLNEILINGSCYNRTQLKERLYKEGIKKRECEECGQGEIWKGKKISLILDHKNGINNDNRLLNLRIACPNCNATFPTHCRGAKGLTIKNKKIDGRKNPRLKKRTINRPPLEQLKEEILHFGYSATGRKYGVSDNAIRKWVKSYEKYGI